MELKELIIEKNSLIWQLNFLQEKYNQNEFDENIVSKMMEIKEKINKTKKKIDILKFKDKTRE